jgi:hypothetical protein
VSRRQASHRLALRRSVAGRRQVQRRNFSTSTLIGAARCRIVEPRQYCKSCSRNGCHTLRLVHRFISRRTYYFASSGRHLFVGRDFGSKRGEIGFGEFPLEGFC